MTWNTKIEAVKASLKKETEEAPVEFEDVMQTYEEPDWVKPTEDLDYIVAIGREGTAMFLDTPLIHESFFENAKDMLDDNGFGIEEGLVAGVYKFHFKFWTSTDWESGIVDDWGFDQVGEPELLFEYVEVEENADDI